MAKGNKMALGEGVPNLDVIYEAFGENADLYRDVLKLKSSEVDSEEIQIAYFDRRSELFSLLASIDDESQTDDTARFHAERQMDAVVMAVRILGDSKLRRKYDDGRLSSSLLRQKDPDGHYNLPKKNIRKLAALPPSDESTIMESFYSEDGTVLSDWTDADRMMVRRKTRYSKQHGVLSNITNNSIVAKIQEEVAGTFEDTLVSFEQVFNAFTLQEREIVAVMGRIDKAKRQLGKRR